MGKIIKTPLPLVYVEQGAITIVPGILPEHQSEIWGIFSGNLYYKLTVEKNVTWNQLMEKAMLYKVGERNAILPTKQQYAAAHAEIIKFNKTVYLLQKSGIAADAWESALYCSRDLVSTSVVLFNMKDGSQVKMPYTVENQQARLALMPYDSSKSSV